MICSKCGAVLAEGSVYCSRCGQEVEIITAIDDLEEEMLREQLREDTPEEDVVTGKVESNRIPSAREERINRKKKKKRMRLLILLIVIAAAAVVAIFGVVRVRQNHSPSYLLRKAEQEYDRRDYESALGYLDRLFGLDEENEDGLLLAGQVYAALYDYENAEHCYLRVIASDPVCVEAYEGILALYAEQGKTDEILALKATVMNEEILALFDLYLTPSPLIQVESGDYDDYLSVEIQSPQSGLSVYYTLDGTTPTKSSTLYTEPVLLEEEGHFILTAICMDADGNYSDIAVAEYEIALGRPEMPTANPDGGQFTYAATITVTVPTGATVYYTWDNSTPTTSSSIYTGPLTVKEGNNILSLVAIDERGRSSDVLKCNYVYYPETTGESLEEEEED